MQDSQYSVSSPEGLQERAYRFGPYRLLPRQRVLECDGVSVVVGSRAFDLLHVLVRKAGQVLSNRELIAAVWPDAVVEENNLRVQMGAVRRALGEWHGKAYIENVPLRGYCFVAPVDVDEAAARRSPSSAFVQARHNLPGRMGDLLGREATLALLAGLCAERRLVSIVGPGGIGKTSVALTLAERLAPSMEDGVRFVDLSTVADGARVAGALAAALGTTTQAEDPLPDVVAAVASLNMLVVLDNCENVIDAAATVAETLVRRAPAVTVLCTSREPLRVLNETIHRLEPLACPPEHAPADIAQVSAYPAVALFISRARYSLPEAEFTDADVPLLLVVCRHLDGLPLAIELAAARFDMFGLRGLADQLDDRLQLLGQGQRGALPRHQTLRATLDWSYALLAPAEQRVLAGLACFRSRFETQAACAVLDIEPRQGTQIIANLVSKSLVVAGTGDDAGTFRMLETTRSYAQERLASSGEQELMVGRHASWCIAEMGACELELRRMGPAPWRRRYAHRIDDVRAALDWCWVADPPKAMQLVAASTALWYSLGLLRECMGRSERALGLLARGVERHGDMELHLRVVFAHCTLVLEGPCHEVDAQLAAAQAAQSDATPPALVLEMAWTSFIRNVIGGNYAATREDAERFGRAAEATQQEEAGFIYHRLMALSSHFLGDQRSARLHIDQALQPAALSTVALMHGSPQQSDHRTTALTHQARILWLQGEPQQALITAHDALAWALDTGHALPAVYALSYACCPVALWVGDLDAAHRYAVQLQEITTRHSLTFWQGWPQLYHAALAARQAGVPVSRLHARGLNRGHMDMLFTLDVDYEPALAPSDLEQAPLVWYVPEVMRRRGIGLVHAGNSRAGLALIGQALEVSREQGAVAWGLRSALSLTRLAHDPADLHNAQMHLLDFVGRYPAASASADLHAARGLLPAGEVTTQVPRRSRG